MTISMPTLQYTAKLAIATLLATFLVMTPWAQSPASASSIVYNDGNCDLAPSSANVYDISTSDQLWEITDCSGVNNVFVLQNDIDVTEAVSAPTSSPIGTSASPLTGTLDGDGFSVTGLNITSVPDGEDGAAFFAGLVNAEIKNLTLQGTVQASQQSAVHAGFSLKGSGAITFSNVVVDVNILSNGFGSGLLNEIASHATVNFLGTEFKGTIPDRNGNTAGFVGSVGEGSQLTINSSTNSGAISSSLVAAGFVAVVNGSNLNPTSLIIENSSNLGNVTNTGLSMASGFVGRFDNDGIRLSISHSLNSGKISGANPTGAFLGDTGSGDGTFVDFSGVINEGFVEGTNNVGGLIGYTEAITRIIDSSNRGDVVGNQQTGGLVGASFAALEILNSSNNADVVGTRNTGGLLGKFEGITTISGSINTHDVTATEFSVGGLIGDALGLLAIVSSSNSGAIQADEFVGGLVGLVSDDGDTTKISNISSSANVGSISGRSKAGGLVGDLDANAEFVRSYNTGNVSGQEYQGGLVGILSSGKSLNASEVFNQGNISASSGDAAGLLGVNDGEALKLLNSFNSGSVTGSRFAAGFAVQFRGSLAATNSYQVGVVSTPVVDQRHSVLYKDGGSDPVFESVYTNQTSDSGFPTSTDEQLQQKATYVGWDFDTVWGFVCGTNNFPVLRFANPTATAEQCASQGGDTGSGGAPAPAPTYTGPTLVSQVQPVAAGSSVTFTGSKLDAVTKAMIGTTEVPISSQTATSLTITVPATLAAATYDLVLFSSFGTLSVMGAITITGAQAESVSQTQLLGWSSTLRFIGNSRSLSPAQDSHLRARVLAQPNATTVICWGYTTASSPNAWAIAHATQRAQAACNLVTAANSSVKTVVRLRYGVEKSSAMRSAVQFWR